MGLAQQDLRRTSVVLVVLLTVLSGGLYTPLWYWRRQSALNALDSDAKLPTWAPLAVVAGIAIYWLSSSVGIPSRVASFAVGTGMALLAFQVRGMLVDHMANRIRAVMLGVTTGMESTYSPSTLLTLLFGHMYLQHAINEFVGHEAAWRQEP